MANWAKLQEQLTSLPVAKRAKHGIHFQKSDGSILANFVGKPCHYLDGGLWKPIDTKLLTVADGYYGCPHSDVQVHPDGRVRVVGTDYTQRAELPGAPVGAVDNDRIVREFTGGRQILYITEDGFRQEIILDRIPSLKLQDARKLLATVYGSLPIKYVASLLTATDATGRNSYTYTDVSSLIAWLQAATYPVVIDPDFSASTATYYNVEGASATYATARSTATAVQAALYIGNDKEGNFYMERGFLKFDTSTIGSGSTVTQANLKITITYDASSSGDYIYVKKCDWSSADPLSAGNKDTAFDACLAADVDNSIDTTGNIPANAQKTSANLATDWVSKTGSTYYGLMAKGDHDGTEPSGTDYWTVANPAHATEAYRPVLTVTYTAAASGNPHYAYAQQ